MATEGARILVPGLIAGADLSAAANQYKFVELTAAYTVNICDATTDRVIGVLQNRPKSGEAAEVCVFGLTKVNSDAALSVGNQIGTAADGQAAAYAPGSDTTKYIVGVVVEASGAAGGYATALVNCLAGRGA